MFHACEIIYIIALGCIDLHLHTRTRTYTSYPTIHIGRHFPPYQSPANGSSCEDPMATTPAFNGPNGSGKQGAIVATDYGLGYGEEAGS